jgi:hypothetical protein
MKDKLAIAAVLSTIRAHLDLRMRGELVGLNVDVTVLPPDKIPDDRNLVNLFLYDFRINAAFRNDPLPGRVRGLETGPPPLPLDLYFLLSAFAVDNTDLNVERILGLAVSILHDTPVLGPISIADGTDTYTYAQTERVRITPVQLTLDELTKIWTSFKGPLVPSMSYQVSVVLLESDLPVVVPPPVLRRGDADRGPQAVGTPVPPFPAVDELVYSGADPAQVRRHPRRQPVFERGDPVRVRGTALAAPGVVAVVRLRPPGGGPAVVLPISQASGSDIAVRLDPAAVGEAGLHRLSVEIPTRPGREPLRSQEVPLLVAPVVTDLDEVLQFPPPQAPDQPRPSQPLRLTCDVTLLPGQDVRLLIASRDVPRSDPLAAPTEKADFDVPEIPPGVYPVRLRVDGVDSLPLVIAGQLAIGKEVTVTHA